MTYRARKVKRRRDTAAGVREAQAFLNEVIFGLKLLEQPSLLDQPKENTHAG